MAKESPLLSKCIQRSYSSEILEEFKNVLVRNGYDDANQLNRMRLFALEKDRIVVYLRHPTKVELLTLSWQRHLANLAVLNIYNHS